MELPDVIAGVSVHHDIRGSFGRLLEAALRGLPIAVANEVIYDKDPAESIVAPFERSAAQTGWLIQTEEQLAPAEVLQRVQVIRCDRVRQLTDDMPHRIEMDQWARAGLVLEIASRRGVCLKGRGFAYPRWRLKGTVTGRFGVTAYDGGWWKFNPLIIPRDQRSMVVPNGTDRQVVVLDFRAQDLCTMVAIIPGLARRYVGAVDLHRRTAELIFQRNVSDVEREYAKKEIFVHAYGGRSELAPLMRQNLPELDWLRKKEEGEGARLIQTASAKGFRAALSRALPLLTGEDVRPMFTVHDELVLDASNKAHEQVAEVAKAMELGISQTNGVAYTTQARWGHTYGDAKGE